MSNNLFFSAEQDTFFLCLKSKPLAGRLERKGGYENKEWDEEKKKSGGNTEIFFAVSKSIFFYHNTKKTEALT